MPPNQHDIIVTDADVRQSEEKSSSESPTKIIRDYPNKYPYEVKPGEKPYKLEIVWRNVVIFLLIHYAAFNVFFVPIQKSTFWLAFLFAIIGSWGIAGGAHRLFAHRSYKANRKLQLLLIFFQTIALQIAASNGHAIIVHITSFQIQTRILIMHLEDFSSLTWAG